MENKELSLTSEIDINHDGIEIIGINSICRLCASQNERLIGIFTEEGISNDLANKINLYLPVKVSVNDILPLHCCWNCASTVLAWHELVLTSVETDRKFRNSQFISDKQIIGEPVYENSALSEDHDGSKEDIKEGNPPEKLELKPTCDICKKTVSRRRDLQRHKIACHSSAASICDDVADLTTKSCTECSLSFRNRSQLKEHVKEIHNPDPKRHRRKYDEIDAQFFCDVCRKGFTRKHDMERHKSRLHDGTVDVTDDRKNVRQSNVEILNKCKRKNADGKVFYICDFCERDFSQSYSLIRHRTIHTGVRPYFCHICGKSFRMPAGLTRHIDAFHNRIKNFSCEICKKMFTARASRDEHMNIHTNSRPFICDICGKSFKQKSSLHIHKMFHSDIFRFQCSSCSKKFRRAQDLKVHSWLHTGHRPHSCSKCKAAFRLKHDLKRHLRTHEKTGESTCDDCGSVFSQERYLKMHRKVHKNSSTIVKVEDRPI